MANSQCTDDDDKTNEMTRVEEKKDETEQKLIFQWPDSWFATTYK